MSFEINVSLNGQHYFATSERSITTVRQAAKMIVDFQQRFPETDGFKISISYDPKRSVGMDVTTMLSRNNELNLQEMTKAVGSLCHHFEKPKHLS